jgi:DNA (cytosine-5)-methyltransferase 1
MARPIGIDLFAGAGGLSLGFEQAGFDIVAAVEIDPIHAAVHEYNFPFCKMIAMSVSALTGTQLRQYAGIEDREIDVVFGGPPCQGFSLIGHRALDDPRNSLVNDFLRLVSELKPKYFVFENVKGITVGRHRQLLEELIEISRSYGYEIRLPWRVLNAADFGVPQHRERLILLGARSDLRLPNYPSPVCKPSDSAMVSSLPLGPTCADALSDLPDAEGFEELEFTDEVPVTMPPAASSFAREMRCVDSDAWHSGIVRNWESGVLTSSMRTDHSEISRWRFKSTKPGTVEPISRFFRLPENGLSNTLRAGTDSARGAFTSPRPIHYKFARCVTVREMARLHGFPDWFRLHGTKWHGARQIGNAVPPPLGRAVASSVIGALGLRPRRSTKSIPLGDARLIRLNMMSAAGYFEVPMPIGKRDRKSFAKKRKQMPMNADEAELLLHPQLDFQEMLSV